ncbi:MAG: hypothetical protein ACOCWO_01980 [Candidatus Muiribacteriaceae bacterium]
MKRTILFIFLLLSVLYVLADDFINTPSYLDRSYIELQNRGYKSGGSSYDLSVYKLNWFRKTDRHYAWSISLNEFRSDEKNLKYVSDAVEYRFFSRKGNNDWMIYFLDNRKKTFYDAVIFYYGDVGFGINVNGDSSIDSWARFGEYDVNLLKRKMKSGSTASLDSADFIQRFFLVANYSIRIRKDLMLELDYNGDTTSAGLRYTRDKFSVSYHRIDPGNYFELSELVGVEQDKSVLSIGYSSDI